MNKQTNTAKKGNLWVWGLILLVICANMMEEDLDLAIGLFLLGIAVLIALALYRWIKKLGAAEEHTHDRINHKTDLVIDHSTGKAINRTAHAPSAHSSQEHWKQQLDILLANGTIDRSEYQVMLKQHK